MNKYSKIVALICTCCFLSGCERGHDLDVESAISFKVVLFQHSTTGITKTRECNLHPDSQEFDEIAEWLSANRDGWGDYVATPAFGGALISGSGFSLHVYDGSFVLAFTDRNGKPNQLTKARSSGELDFVFDLPCESTSPQADRLETLAYVAQLTKINPDSLSARSKEILSAATRIIEMPGNGEAELMYLSVFPKTFSEFRAVFQPQDYSELYSAHVELIDLFRTVGMLHAEEASATYVSLIRGVCFDVDAPSFFIDAWKEFRSMHVEEYANSAHSLSKAEQRRIDMLEDVSVHDWTPKEIMCE